MVINNYGLRGLLFIKKYQLLFNELNNPIVEKILYDLFDKMTLYEKENLFDIDGINFYINHE